MSANRPPRPEVLAFLQDIKQNPDDDTPRLILADWLEEHDDPRGEFLRVQCELARIPRKHPRRNALLLREKDLLKENVAEWMGTFYRATLDKHVFIRGLLHVLMPLDTLLEGPWFDAALWTQLEALEWVEELNLQHLNKKGMYQLANSPILSHIGSLRFQIGDPPSVAALHVLATSPHLLSLGSLHVPGARLSERDFTALTTSLAFSRLKVLNLADTGTRGEAVRVLGALAQLERLDLSYNKLGDAGMTIFSELPYSHLKSLNLDMNHIGDRGAKALAEAPHFQQLTQLTLSGNLIGSDGFAALARSGRLRNLAVLDLQNNRIGAKGATALLESSTLQRLVTLNLYGNPIPSDKADLLRERFGSGLTI
jgi:uncharacterized protein (TIGR02996 family)